MFFSVIGTDQFAHIQITLTSIDWISCRSIVILMLGVAIIIQSAVPHPIFNCTDLGLYPYNYPSREVIPSGKWLNSGSWKWNRLHSEGQRGRGRTGNEVPCCALTPELYDLPLHQVQGHYKNKGESPGLIRGPVLNWGNKNSICIHVSMQHRSSKANCQETWGSEEKRLSSRLWEKCRK